MHKTLPENLTVLQFSNQLLTLFSESDFIYSATFYPSLANKLKVPSVSVEMRCRSFFNVFFIMHDHDKVKML